MKAFLERVKKDGWLLALLGLCVALCLLGGMGGSSMEPGRDERLAAILSAIDGAGRVEAAVFCAADGTTPTGAVIVAAGAEDMTVQLQLARAAATLLGLEAEQIEIFKLKEGAR